MCFSATASFVAGTAISAVGVVTLKESKIKKFTPFAAIPFLFGVQQIIEGVVWVSFGSGLSFLNQIATYSYVFFAYLLWPVFVPFSVMLIETDLQRKKIIYAFFALGATVSLYLLLFIIQNHVVSRVVNESIAYPMPTQYGILPITFYLFATCGSCLFSSHRKVNIFGIIAVLSLAVAYYYYTASFLSVWCFFAAILSIFVYWYIKTNK